MTDQHSEAVERVARALARHDNPKHENWWPSYEKRARAAIAAMPTPSDQEKLISELREALQAIEDGEGDADVIARQTLVQLGIPTRAALKATDR